MQVSTLLEAPTNAPSFSLDGEPREPVRESALARSLSLASMSALRDILARTSRPDILSFAIGLTGQDLFPLDGLAASARHVLAADVGALQYRPPPGGLKAQVARLLEARGIHCRPEQVFLTTGTHQSMDLLVRLLLDPGDPVIIERTVYEAFLSVLKVAGGELVTVPSDPRSGIDLDAVEACLAAGARPAFIYTIPCGHNPLGVSMDQGARERLVELARRYAVPVLEDDAYGFLHYGQGVPPAMRSLDEDHVFYMGSVSKILAPGLRVGWIVAPERFLDKLSVLKQVTDSDIGNFSQAVVSRFIEAHSFDEHLDRVRRAYQERRDAMVAALAESFPSGVRWNVPASGMFIWLELPRELDATRLLGPAVEDEKVAFAPGRVFAADGGRHGTHCLRLNFVLHPPDAIREGIARLARAVRRSSTVDSTSSAN